MHRQPNLNDELKIKPGTAPKTVKGPIVERDGFVASEDAFVLTFQDKLRFHYRRGAGVRYAAAPELNAAAISLFHNGSVHGAAAWMNGYIPLHASAVASGGRVHAFSGSSGEGKSTLVAALAHRGLKLFADDVLTLATTSVSVHALPGRKRLKLWSDALELTGATGKERVWPGVDKYFVGDELDAGGPSLPLASLTILETNDNDDVSIARVGGAERLLAIRDSCYRPEYRLPDRATSSFSQMALIAQSIPIFRFSRPRNLGRFAEGVNDIVAYIEGAEG